MAQLYARPETAVALREIAARFNVELADVLEVLAFSGHAEAAGGIAAEALSTARNPLRDAALRFAAADAEAVGA